MRVNERKHGHDNVVSPLTLRWVRSSLGAWSCVAIKKRYPSDVPSILDAMLRSIGGYDSINLSSKRLQMCVREWCV